MTNIQLSLINIPHYEAISMIFVDYSEEYAFTANGVFRRLVPPLCRKYGMPMIAMASTAAAKEILVKHTLDATCAELADNQFKKTVVFGIN